MNKKIIIFGGSGFIGSILTKTLLQDGSEVCVICNNKKKAVDKIGDYPNLKIKTINIFDYNDIANLLKDYDVVINLIGKLFEIKKGDFKKFHHDFPKILLQNISDKQHLIHISALGIEKSAKTSIYARTKLDGQKLILKSSKNYNIIKPSIVFGEGDGFFNLFAKIAKISPFLPIIGGGKSKFSPVYVGDLVSAIVVLVDNRHC